MRLSVCLLAGETQPCPVNTVQPFSANTEQPDCCVRCCSQADMKACCRDSDGNLFLKDPPYVTDPYSLERIALGLPFPVKCCWNGLVVMSAAPFSQHNLRVRYNLLSEFSKNPMEHFRKQAADSLHPDWPFCCLLPILLPYRM